MKKVDDLIDLFFTTWEETSEETLCEENFNDLERTVEQSDPITPPKPDTLMEHLKSFPNRDQIKIFVFKGNQKLASLVWNTVEKEDLNGKRREVSLFIDNITNSLTPKDNGDEEADEKEKTGDDEDEEEKKSRLEITINKRKDNNNRLSIYSFEKVMDFLTRLTLSELYITFDKIFDYNQYTAFVLQDEDAAMKPFYTSSFYFVHEDYDDFDIIKRQKRDDLNNKRNEEANFLNASEYPFIPQDFYLQNRSADKQFNQLMEKLLVICSLTYLGNVTSLEDGNNFSFQLSAYRKSIRIIDFEKMVPGSSQQYQEYIKIFNWVYSEGSVVDKIGLTRNVISLQIDNDTFPILESGTFDSIKSSHLVYLKENVEKYIDVINKISQSIFDVCQKTTEMVDSFTGTFKKNVTAFISYFISLIISNAFGGGKFKDIFTLEITIISASVLLVSLGFFWVSINDTKRKKMRFFKNFIRLKSRYKAILDKKDLENIFKRNIDIKAEMAHINSQVKRYRNLWLGTIFVFLLVILYFGVYLKIV